MIWLLPKATRAAIEETLERYPWKKVSQFLETIGLDHYRYMVEKRNESHLPMTRKMFLEQFFEAKVAVERLLRTANAVPLSLNADPTQPDPDGKSIYALQERLTALYQEMDGANPEALAARAGYKQNGPRCKHDWRFWRSLTEAFWTFFDCEPSTKEIDPFARIVYLLYEGMGYGTPDGEGYRRVLKFCVRHFRENIKNTTTPEKVKLRSPR